MRPRPVVLAPPRLRVSRVASLPNPNCCGKPMEKASYALIYICRDCLGEITLDSWIHVHDEAERLHRESIR